MIFLSQGLGPSVEEVRKRLRRFYEANNRDKLAGVSRGKYPPDMALLSLSLSLSLSIFYLSVSPIFMDSL